MSAKVSIIEVPVPSAPTGLTEEPVAILNPTAVAFQQNAFQSNAFQMVPLAPSLDPAIYPASVTIIEIVPG